MRLLFSASDATRVALVESMLNKANIHCEVRQAAPDRTGIPEYPEVWVRDGVDFEYATLIFCNWASRQEQEVA